MKGLLLVVAASALVVSIGANFGMRTVFMIPIIVIIAALTFYYHQFWKISTADVTSYLDRHFIQLEESSGLVIRTEEELSGLQHLQQQKIDRELTLLKLPFYPGSSWWWIVFVVIALGLSSVLLFYRPTAGEQAILNPSKAVNDMPVKERVPVQVASFTVQVNPPAYTRVATRIQQQFSVRAEVGSTVRWVIKTNQAIEKSYLIFDGKTRVKMNAIGEEKMEWSASRIKADAGFYQVEIDGNKSDLYQIDVIPDLPVIIKVTHPKQHSSIDIGQPAVVDLKLSLKDDYGISAAFITATMASGKGEGVSFTEKKLPFNFEMNNKTSVALTKHIDLKSLGMKPGDELYFYINATDNHGQNSRSDIFFVSIVDTTELMSMAGMTSGVNLVPEYFRSQRQIIIDTEKLLKEKAGISERDYKDRSNEIGVDQKLLRLRYGKFLGEESETEIGADHEHKEGEGHHEDEGAATEKIGDVKAIMDQYAHKHDIAEDATFFEPELKAQLKAVLTEMWSSELRLRTYRPQEALPFEYKALRLLKDLQQKSRAYVAKTTVKTTQLKDEKRLSGELDKINQTIQNEKFSNVVTKTEELRRALAVLEQTKRTKRVSADEAVFLRGMEKYLIAAASGNPASYLKALSSLRKLSSVTEFNSKDAEIVQAAIKRLLPADHARPQASMHGPANTLYQSYFKNLKATGK